MHIRGLTVYVTDNKGNHLPEWGTQRLRQCTDGEKTSAYIQSTTGVQFQVSVQPDIPVIEYDSLDSKCTAIRPCADSEGREGELQQNSKYSKERIISSSPMRRQERPKGPPDYSFLASLYLDGRSRPERRVIVYTDPADPDFNAPSGKVSFRHRWVSSRDGSIAEHAWVFKENAIENVLDRLTLAGSECGLEEMGAEEITAALEHSGLASADDSCAEKNKVGQIVLEIRRVVLGTKTYDANYRSKHREGQDDDIDMNGINSNITHAAGFLYNKKLAPTTLRVVDYWDYNPQEGNWAIFQFFYRSADQLQKFGFHGFKTGPRLVSRNGRALEGHLASLTPLSMLKTPSPNSSKQKPKSETYEEKVKTGRFATQNGKGKYAFGDMYREWSEQTAYGTGPAQRKIASTSVASSLKGADTSRQQGSARNVVSLGDTNAITTKSTIPPHIIKKDGVLQVSYRPQHQPSPDAPREPSPPESSTKANPPMPLKSFSSISAEQKTLEPSPASQTTANIVNIIDYAPSSLNEADGEAEDTDDEPNTESDLETHVGEDDIEYVTNPEEDEEVQHMLREHLMKIEIRKRSHAQIDDDLDGDRHGGHHKDQVDKTELGSDGIAPTSQESGSLLLLGGRKDQGHELKKVKTKLRNDEVE